MPTTVNERYDLAAQLLSDHGFPAGPGDDGNLIEAVMDVLGEVTMTEDRLDPEVKARWVEALRSERYEQGAGYLRAAEDMYCCLGVLCDLIAPDEWSDEPSPVANAYTHGGPAEAMTMPPLTVQYQAIGRPIPDPVHPPRIVSAIQHLASVNDAGGTFDLIADLIERYL